MKASLNVQEMRGKCLGHLISKHRLNADRFRSLYDVISDVELGHYIEDCRHDAMLAFPLASKITDGLSKFSGAGAVAKWAISSPNGVGGGRVNVIEAYGTGRVDVDRATWPTSIENC